MLENKSNDRNKNSFIELYNKESTALFRYLLIRTSSREVAMDISQESFMRLWRSMEKEGKILNARAFLYAIAKNQVIDWYKKKKSQSLDSLGESEEGQSMLERFILDDGSQRVEELSADGRFLLEKIKELDSPYQEVVYLRFVEDLRPQEIAEVLNESVNQVSVRITRGLEKLRKIAGIKTETRNKKENGK
jgi:RNA polymerase sigma factor (sigma-70 family)